ncbi:hypothetical protein AK812_SmicGene46543, partial [Symbiodinium microadriaticum]
MPSQSAVVPPIPWLQETAGEDEDVQSLRESLQASSEKHKKMIDEEACPEKSKPKAEQADGVKSSPGELEFGNGKAVGTHV